ncbi:MAG: tetratricopeptide repeat protein [Chloroflexi bacterium]|nr:tetratricopeptide repeat protein [Chloroflexota bacterium]
MMLFQSEEHARIKRLKVEQAVSLAMQSRWADAAELNRQIVDANPKDVEAHNRLGKALMELGRLDDAREAYNHALRTDPTNTIAQKNSQRLERLMEEAVPVEPSAAPVDPSLFIEETGRTTTTSLVQVAPSEVLAKMDAGDPVTLEVQGNSVLAVNSAGEFIGKLEPKIRQRIVRLTGLGNQYAAIVTAVDDETVRIIIRETHRDASMGNRPSFPTTGEAFRGYVRDSLLRYELDDEDEDLEETDQEPDHDVEMSADEVPLDHARDARDARVDDDEDDDA